jgi:hypothetical protein
MDSIVIQRVPRIVLCELCKKTKDKKCISPRGDVDFAVLAGRCGGFKSHLDIETLEKINTLLDIERYLSDMMERQS